MEIYLRAQDTSVSEAEFRAAHAGISLPDLLTAAALDGHGAEPVLETPAPTVTAFQSARRNGTAVVAGKRVMAWSVTDWPQAQIDAYRADARERQWDAIKHERDRRKAGGVLVGANWFHTDDGSRIQQIGLVMMGVNIPANLQWKTMDGSFVIMSKDLAGQIFLAIAAQDQAIFAKAEQHKAAMEAATDPASYNFLTGWPAVYGE